MATRFKDHFLKGTHAARPAAATPPIETKYACSDHGLIYETDGATWSTWFDPTTAVASSTRTINAQTGTTYTAVLADANRTAFLTLSNAASIAFTVPTNASVAYPVGSVIEGAQLGAGQVTITPAGGVTINATPGLKVAAQYGTFGLLKTATDTWLAYGRLSA